MRRRMDLKNVRLSRGPQDRLNGFGLPFVLRRLRLELLHTRFGERVETHLAVGLRGAPRGGDPAVEQDFLEGRVQRPLLDPERIRRQRVNSLCDRVSVQRSRAKDTQYQEDER